MYLPQEIIHYIVDHDHDDRTLATLRLLNHAWNISASLHLFRTVNLDLSVLTLPPGSQPVFTGVDKSNVLLSLLESRTETISHCVRQVVLGQRYHADYRYQYLTERQQNGYAVLIQSIVSRFTHMSDIEFLRICHQYLTPSFSSCILGICKSATLESIEFWDCSMPTVSTYLDIIQASSNLKTLRLFSGTAGLPDPSSSSPSSSSSENQYCTNITAPLLHSLTVRGTPDYLLRVFRLDKLKQLNWTMSYGSVSGTEFLKAVGKSLESLVIKPKDLSEVTLQLDLSHCPRLKYLRISGLRWSFSTCPSTYFRSLFAQTPDQSLPIEHLKLVVHPSIHEVISYTDENTPSNSAGLRGYCHPKLYQHQCQHQCQYGDGNDIVYHCSKLCWLSVDDSLSRSQIFQSLKLLEIFIQDFTIVDLSSLSDTFPKLKNKGVQVIWM